MNLTKLFTGLLKNIIKIENSKSSQKIKTKKINDEINKTYKFIINQDKKDTNKLADNIINNLRMDIAKKRDMRYKGKTWQHSLGGKRLSEKEIARQKEIRKALKRIQLQEKQKNEIINAKIAGKTKTQRINRNSNKLKTDVKKSLKKDISLVKRFNQEIRRTKNLLRNENHRLTERVKDFGINLATKLGFSANKKWNCTFKNSRDAHIAMHGQISDKDGYFHHNGYKAKYPGGFGVAKLDINCHCYITVTSERK